MSPGNWAKKCKNQHPRSRLRGCWLRKEFLLYAEIPTSFCWRVFLLRNKVLGVQKEPAKQEEPTNMRKRYDKVFKAKEIFRSPSWR
jgi:hypothetical protein